jgi:glycosyltransferase involved in cell wall biosynthesis
MSIAPVSVIIPCYCCMDTIVRAVESVANQTLRPKELVLVDDGSTDNTQSILLELQKKYDRGWIKIKLLDRNHGVSHARNVGWGIASQEYIAFLDADDICHSRKIDLQYSWMRKHPDVDGSGHDYHIINTNSELPPLCFNSHPVTYPLTFSKLLFSNPLTPSTVMLKRSTSLMFSYETNYCEDHLLWMQLLSEGYILMLLESSLLYKCVGRKNASNKLWKMRLADIKNYKRLQKLGKLNILELYFFIILSILKFVSLLIIGTKAQYGFKKFISNFLKNDR